MDEIINTILNASDEDKSLLFNELINSAKRWQEKHPKEYKHLTIPAPCSKCGNTDIRYLSDLVFHKNLDGYEGQYYRYECTNCDNKTIWCKDALTEWNKNNPWPNEEEEI
ncbi:hypothetical protein [Selenomonas ruminantium]|uniref:hypothetical protein n=1 Tax=Selenomonas ruminantium TaxID=971 RepID=UPI0026F12973|nr:hypothetical protein [Selenomonas ruminantium]